MFATHKSVLAVSFSVVVCVHFALIAGSYGQNDLQSYKTFGKRTNKHTHTCVARYIETSFRSNAQTHSNISTVSIHADAQSFVLSIEKQERVQVRKLNKSVYSAYGNSAIENTIETLAQKRSTAFERFQRNSKSNEKLSTKLNIKSLFSSLRRFYDDYYCIGFDSLLSTFRCAHTILII